MIWDTNSNSMYQWERGIDRLMDAEVLDDCSQNARFGFFFSGGSNCHCVMLDEIFETFNCTFSVNFPDPDMSD